MIPLQLDKLLKDTIVESNRIEFKRSWNPESIMHTICAFANDIDNIGGGYIIVGVGEVDGKPADYVGVPPDSVQKIDKELFRLCNLITPRYVPETSFEEYDGKIILLIWVLGGEMRPYKCPPNLSSKKSERQDSVAYVRRMSNTVRANQEEEYHLIRVSNRIPFDSMLNTEASVNDIMRGLVDDYLTRTESKMDRSIGNLDLYRSMRIVRGPVESPKPVNIGLMMFSDDPEEYFPGARIEVVNKPYDTGDMMDIKIFRGPLDKQIRDTLNHVSTLAITMRIIKVKGQMESMHLYSYPEEAIREAIVNAVYHKNYQLPDPIKITVYPDRIEVFNRPGPDRSISNERLRELDLKSETYLNQRLGDYLKALKLAEGQNTGIPKMIKAMEMNGSDPPIVETDDDRRFTRLTLPIHREFLDNPPRIARREEKHEEVLDENMSSKYRDPEETKSMILESLRVHGCQSSKELAKSLGYAGANNTFRRCVAELMASGDVEYLYPGSPKDKRQKICLSRRR